ncbi:MAG: NAD(P)-dependent oxidoreductase [Gammaproteobacteria bacterium]
MKENSIHIGLVGLGIIGSSIFRNVSKSDFKTTGFDIDQEKLDELSSEGLCATSSMDSLLNNCNIVITSLPSNQALDQTIDSILDKNDSKVQIIIETSTLSLECKKRNEEKTRNVGISMLDCPISGTGKQAELADIVLYASGSEESYESVLPILETFSKESFFLGHFGNGTKVKLIANLLVSIHNVASAEAVRLAEESGIDLDEFYKVIASGAGTSKIFELRAPMMIEREYLPATMKMDVWRKDMRLIREMINSFDLDSPLFNVTDELYKKAEEKDLDALDTASIFEVLKDMHKES